MEAAWWLGYAIWLLAGLADFHCHRRAGLTGTSGVAEARLHLLQIGLLGVATVLVLAFRPGLGLTGVVAILVVAHAIVAYFDTRTAYGVRPITPFEQHVHSILDLAPWIALGVLATRRVDEGMGLGLSLRTPALPAALWLAVLLPSAMCCALPAALELWASIRQRHPVDA
jgi:hypothetical protein